MPIANKPLPFSPNGKEPLLISGPCSAETEEQVVCTAQQLRRHGCQCFRAGVWKPRTKPGGFEGNGEIALQWLQRVKKETGMLVATEVATPEHVEKAMEYAIDILWIGARTTASPFAIQELADCLRGSDACMLIKNPMSPDLGLWMGAFERLERVGIKRMAAIHRGFTSFGNKIYRNAPMWQVPIELRRRMPELTIICDPSHIGGKKELIKPLSQHALDLGFDGLIVETHCQPEQAWTDKEQQLTPDKLYDIIHQLVIREKKKSNKKLLELRNEIDEIDHQLIELLGKRMDVSREIGHYKRDNNIAILQPERYDEIMVSRELLGKQYRISAETMRKVFQSIHEESITQQRNIIKRK